jgi:hypothetical protein
MLASMRTWQLAFGCLFFAAVAYVGWIFAIAEDREGDDVDSYITAGLFWLFVVASLVLFITGITRAIRSRRARRRKT